MKNLKYLIPFLAASFFPMYWQFMAAQFVWLATDAASRAILAAGSFLIVGAWSTFAVVTLSKE